MPRMSCMTFSNPLRSSSCCMIYGFCNEDTFASGLLVCMSVPGTSRPVVLQNSYYTACNSKKSHAAYHYRWLRSTRACFNASRNLVTFTFRLSVALRQRSGFLNETFSSSSKVRTSLFNSAGVPSALRIAPDAWSAEISSIRSVRVYSADQ